MSSAVAFVPQGLAFASMAQADRRSLASGVSVRPTTQPAENHPARKLNSAVLKQSAASLEAWFDAGVKQVYEDGQTSVNGQRQLPEGYSGFTQDSVLVEAFVPGILVWPVRFDVGEASFDTISPCTLYHYTHRKSFEKFASAWTEERQSMSKYEISNVVLSHLSDDFTEREPSQTNENPNGDLEMCTIEPGNFVSKEEILNLLLGSRSLKGVSSQGSLWEDFADFCIAVRVPGSACLARTRRGTEDRTMVLLSKQTLEVLNKRSEFRRNIEKKHAQEKKQKLQQHKTKARSGGFLTFLCCGSSKDPPPEFWDDEDLSKKKKQLANGREVVDRPKREIDFQKQKLRKTWTQEHFIKVQEIESKERMRLEEEQRIQVMKEAAIKAQLQEEAKRVATAGRTVIKVAGDEKKKKEATVPRGNEEDKPKKTKTLTMFPTKKPQQNLEMYEQFAKKDEQRKDIARGALAQIKMRRSAPSSRLAAEQPTGRRRSPLAEPRRQGPGAEEPVAAREEEAAGWPARGGS